MAAVEFSLQKLLLIFPAIALAFLLAIAWDRTVIRDPLFVPAFSQCRQLSMLIAFEQKMHPTPIPEATCNQWLAGTLPSNDPMKSRLAIPPEMDPWGTPYQCVLDFQLPDGQTVPVGVYSCGQDRTSATQGQDADDLNSWDDASWRYYAHQTDFRAARRNILVASIITPFTYLGILGCVTLLRWLSTLARSKTLE